MGNRITIRECNVDITLSGDDIFRAFQGGTKIEPVPDHGKSTLRIMTETEQGWIGIWAERKDKNLYRIYAYGCSRSFYSRNGRWFLDTLEEIAVEHKGNLLLITREPDTGGGRTTIISQGEVIYGCFSRKLGSPFGFKTIWKSQYDPKKDVDKSIDVKVHDVAKDTEEMIRINPI
jgi:hypothetical protein